MSDLIDFESPSTTSKNAQSLALPLIPSPEAGPPVFSGQRRSVENNPFDMVLKKITEYERNKDDPFEKVIEKAATGRVAVECTVKDSTPKRRRHSNILKLNKTLDDTESKVDLSLVAGVDDISIITDLNDTNLIADNVAGEKVGVVIWDCDKNVIPGLNVSPVSFDADLSILNQSAMNDSLLDNQLTKDPSMSLFARPRSMSQCNFLSPEQLASSKSNRRSLSVTDTPKNNIHNIDGSIASTQSSLFEDPFNNAFRTTSLRSNASSNFNGLNSQFDLSRQRVERLNSDSSVFSGLSNISAITTDPFRKVRQDRFCSDSSIYSNISNLSVIPNNTVPSCDSSIFVNDTMNRGFVNSRLQLSSTNSATSLKSPSLDKSDLIKQFYQIKSSTSMSQKIEGKLIDVGYSSASISANETGFNEIISTEARTLAETFEKMASSKHSNTTEDELLLSKTQLNFDDLPPSDDEAIDNLIELSGGESEIKKSSEDETKSNAVSQKDDVKALENEFLDHKDPDKKTAAATLLLDLEKLIKEQDNPDAFKVLTDLQKMLGVECLSNTEILQACFENSMSPQHSKKLKSNTDSSRCIADTSVKSNDRVELANNKEHNAKEISGNKSSNSSNDVTDLNVENESKDIISDNIYSQSELKKESREQKKNNVTSEDQKLAWTLLQTLNKIVDKNDENSAVEVLKSLGTVLNMASELSTKNKFKQVPQVKKVHDSKAPKMNRSVSSFYKSPNKKSLTVKEIQNASFETLPLRRSISVNSARNNNSNNLLDIPCKDKRKSNFLSLKKRFPSDPGFADAADKKKIEAATSKSTLATRKPAIEPIKTKLKKKASSAVVSKKGPMKAVMPLGSMQKVDVKHAIKALTPPPKTHESVPSVKIISSTPNSRESTPSGNSKSKPAASSTPNMSGLKTQRLKAASLNSSKGTVTCSLSPVSVNSSSKANATKKTDHSKSPLKKSTTPRKSENKESSRLPKFSPRPARVRNFSFTETKTSKSPQLSSGSLKVASEKTQRHSSVLSPLKNCNKVSTKRGSLMPRLSKSIVTNKSGPEKENYA